MHWLGKQQLKSTWGKWFPEPVLGSVLPCIFNKGNRILHQWRAPVVLERILTLAMPEMMIVLFFTGDLSFCLADWWSCLMAASATGSVPLSISSSVSEEDRALLTVAAIMDACSDTRRSDTRRSDSLDLGATALWVGSKLPPSKLNGPVHGKSKTKNG